MASTYTLLKKGSTGNEVNALQTALNKKGYSLQNTGLYDDATEAAVKRYQQDYGLDVDGIAGDTTLGSLYGTSQQSVGGYTPSAQLVEAQKYAQSVQAQKPEEYESAYTDQLQAQFDAIMNRQPFKYDIGSDASFQQMSDMYVQQGRRAMQDTMGQAAALTGGYGNSYAQGAGQAAYGNYLQQLGALAPEYEQQAYTRWQGEGADMMDRYQMTADREQDAYSRYMDRLNQYYEEADRAQQAADDMYNREYGEYMDRQNYDFQQQQFAQQQKEYEQSIASENRDYAYNTALMMLQGGQMPSTDLLTAAGISQADAAAIMAMYTPKATSGGSGGSGSSGEKKNIEVPDGYFNIYADSGVNTLKTGIDNGSVKVSNTDVEDGILSRRDWELNANNFANNVAGINNPVTATADNEAAISPMKAAAALASGKSLKDAAAIGITQADTSRNEAYDDYVERVITSDYLAGNITKGKAKDLIQKYLLD